MTACKSIVALLACCLTGITVHADGDSDDFQTYKLENKLLWEELQRRLRVEEQMQHRINKLEGKMEDLATTCAETQAVCSCQSNDKRALSADTEIGFMATRSVDQHNLQVNQPILFDTVITNIGNAYDKGTGRFLCPLSGTYLFNMNVVSNESNYVEASIVLNGVHVVHALSDHRATSIDWDQGSTAAILQLTEGDVVTVEIQWPPGDNNVHGNRYTTFSGYLLRAVQ